MHTIFEVSGFSCSRDIGVRILKIWASSAILDSTLSSFTQFRSFPGATEYHLVKFERNLPRAAELKRCNCFSNCRTLGAPIGQMDLRVGGHSCTGSAAGISAIHYCFRFLIFSARNGHGVENGAKFRTF